MGLIGTFYQICISIMLNGWRSRRVSQSTGFRSFTAVTTGFNITNYMVQKKVQNVPLLPNLCRFEGLVWHNQCLFRDKKCIGTTPRYPNKTNRMDITFVDDLSVGAEWSLIPLFTCEILAGLALIFLKSQHFK